MSDQYEIEWRSWGAVVVELRRCGIEMNDVRSFYLALVRWGEELAMLRRFQNEKIAVDCLARARADYPKQATQTQTSWELL